MDSLSLLNRLSKYNLIQYLFCFILLCSCIEQDRKEIVCWGDSLTSPHYKRDFKTGLLSLIRGESDYPTQLQDLLGDEYKIINCGVGGENTLTIMARQGAFPMKLAHDVKVFKNEEREYKTFIGNNDVDGFISSYNGKPVTPLLQLGWEEGSSAQLNPCVINGRQYIISSESKNWIEDEKYQLEYNYYIEPCHDFVITDTLKKGCIVETFAMRYLRNKYANIYFIGQNGGFEDVADLIRQLKNMISYSQSDRYIVISFHKPNRVISTIPRMKEMEDSLRQFFGDNFINLREYMVEKGLSDSGLKPTKEDLDSIKNGQVPPQLLKDGCHFTPKGYNEIAKLVYSKMKELHY